MTELTDSVWIPQNAPNAWLVTLTRPIESHKFFQPRRWAIIHRSMMVFCNLFMIKTYFNSIKNCRGTTESHVINVPQKW